MKKRTIAALQLGSELSNTTATVDKILSYEQQIQDSDCDLLVLPEALLGGYPKGANFGTRVGYRTEKGRDDFLHYWEQAIDIDGPEVSVLSELAISCKTCIVIGVIERKGSSLYCTALFISADGELAALHRKLMPTASERLIWAQGDGSTLPVLETHAGRVGAAICWENYMPLLRTAMYAKGMDIWCAPTVDDREIWQSSMRHIAYEGRNFLVSACQYLGSPSDQRAQEINWPQNKPFIRGGSVIISPMGEVLAGPLYDQEGLISAEIDLDEIIRARYDLDPVGHYSRPDIFKLLVDESVRPPYSSNAADRQSKPE